MDCIIGYESSWSSIRHVIIKICGIANNIQILFVTLPVENVGMVFAAIYNKGKINI